MVKCYDYEMENVNTEKLDKFCQENGVKFVVLFGSRAKEARGEKALVREDSDFDIAVLTLPEKNIGKNMDNYNNILFGLCNIMNIPDYKMDLTNLNNADPFLKYQIYSNDLLLYGDKREYKSFKLFAIREYMDMSDLRSFEYHMVLKRQKLLNEKLHA